MKKQLAALARISHTSLAFAALSLRSGQVFPDRRAVAPARRAYTDVFMMLRNPGGGRRVWKNLSGSRAFEAASADPRIAFQRRECEKCGLALIGSHRCRK